MKKQINEPDFIGGLGTLTKEEEAAISQYLARKKAKTSRKRNTVFVSKKSRQKISS